MVDNTEIKHLADLIKVELKEPETYVKQVEQILNYFERLDKVEFASDEQLRKEISFDSLREDKNEPFSIDGKLLIEKLNKDQNNFIRAPKMI